jgi:hypothetical protein
VDRVWEHQWAADQYIEETDNGVVIYFSSTQYHKVLEWILSRGCTARPFKPEALVKDWEHHIIEMGKMIQESSTVNSESLEIQTL